MYPPVYMIVFILAQWWLSLNYPVLALDLSPWGFWLGVSLVVIGFVVSLLIKFQFKRAETSIIPYKECDALLTTGFFAYSRNPIYLMMAIVLFGSGLMFSNLAALIIVPIFPIIIQWRFIRAEEATIESAFGEEFREYKSKVRRWL
jgi:protein-S-isoprenylcysteine O-methyltransferase Ste14